MQWITPALQTKIAKFLDEKNEIPDYLNFYSPDIIKSFSAFSQLTFLPSAGNQVLYKRRNLLFDTLPELLAQINPHKKPVNLFNLESSLESTIPFVYELSSKGILNQLISVSLNAVLINHNHSQIEDFLNQGFNQTKTRMTYLNGDLEISVIKTEKFYTKNSDQINLFVLKESRLGNAVSPINYLSNLSQSLQSGDYLLVVQNLYGKLNENQAIEDYASTFRNNQVLLTDHALALEIVKTHEVERFGKWVETEGLPRVEVGYKIPFNVNYLGIDLNAGQELIHFRSTFFKLAELKNLFHRFGFLELSYYLGEEGNFGIFLLEKE